MEIDTFGNQVVLLQKWCQGKVPPHWRSFGREVFNAYGKPSEELVHEEILER